MRTRRLVLPLLCAIVSLLGACASTHIPNEDVAFDRPGIEQKQFESDLDEACWRAILDHQAAYILIGVDRHVVPHRGAVVREMEALGYTRIPVSRAEPWQIYPRWKATPIVGDPSRPPPE